MDTNRATELLTKAAAQFRMYSKNHADKVAKLEAATPLPRDQEQHAHLSQQISDTLRKSAVNAEFAREIEEFLNAN